MTENTELTARREENFALGRLQPQNVNELFFFAKQVSASNMFPGVDTPEKAFLLMSQGIELNLSPLQAVRELNIINGRVDVPASVRAANIQASPKTSMWAVESDDSHCTITAERADRKGQYTVTIRAEDMSLADKNKHKEHMADWLYARAVRRASRQFFADLNLGLGSDETPEPERVIDVAVVERQVAQPTQPCVNPGCGGTLYLRGAHNGGGFMACDRCSATSPPTDEMRDLIRGHKTVDALPEPTAPPEGRDATPEEIAALASDNVDPVIHPDTVVIDTETGEEIEAARAAWTKAIIAELKAHANTKGPSPEHKRVLDNFGWLAAPGTTKEWLAGLNVETVELLRAELLAVHA